MSVLISAAAEAPTAVRIMIEHLTKLRYVSLVAVVCSSLGSVVMFGAGALKTGKALGVFFTDWRPEGEYQGVSDITLATKYVVQSLDAFLVALVLMIFSSGIFFLVVRKGDTDSLSTTSWLRVKSIGHLKNILAEVIVIILFVQFLELILLQLDRLAWEMLVLPVGIALLAVSLKLLALRE